MLCSGNVFSSKFYFSSQNILLKVKIQMFIDNIVRTLSFNILIQI